MSQKWSRRTLLAAIGSATVAGCLGNSNDESSPGDNAQTDTAETPTQQSSTDEESAGGTTTPTPATPSTPDSIEGSWPMPAADPGLSNYNSDSAGPANPVTQLWETQTQTNLSAPILADETLYLGEEDGGVHALDARTGETRWQHALDLQTDTPWFRDGQLYVPTDGEIVSLNASDGTERWRVQTGTQAAVLLASHGLYTVSETASEIRAFDTADGTERWRTEINDPWIPTLFASDDHVFLSTDTKYLVPWGFDPKTGQYLTDLLGEEAPTQGHMYHTPGERFYLDGHIYTSDTMYGRIQSYRTNNSYTHEWTTHVGLGNTSSPLGAGKLAAGSDNLYAAGYETPHSFHAFSLSDGTEVWKIKGNAKLAAKPVVTTANVYLRTKDALRCFSTADGTEQWSLSGSGVGTQCIVVDDIVYTTDSTTVRAFRPA